jgi:hypothetical protein
MHGRLLWWGAPSIRIDASTKRETAHLRSVVFHHVQDALRIVQDAQPTAARRAAMRIFLFETIASPIVASLNAHPPWRAAAQRPESPHRPLSRLHAVLFLHAFRVVSITGHRCRSPRRMDVTHHRRSFALLAALCVPTASCAHLSEDTSVHTRNETPATDAAYDVHANARHANGARDIADRLLALIDGIRGRDDLARTRVERATGLTLSVETDTVYLYGARGALADGWSYRLGATAGEDDGVDSLLFAFHHADGDGADMTAICDPDFDAYRTALQDKGFDVKPVPGDRGSTRFWEFRRDGVTVRIRTIGESRARPEHACVSSISIRA